MSEVLEGTVGIWGIASAETAAGIIIRRIKELTRSEKKYIRNNKGCRQGRSEYDESVEVNIEAEVLASDSFDQKLGAELAITNSISLANMNTANTGKTLIDEIGRERDIEEWEKVTVDAEVLPFFPAV